MCPDFVSFYLLRDARTELSETCLGPSGRWDEELFVLFNLLVRTVWPWNAFKETASSQVYKGPATLQTTSYSLICKKPWNWSFISPSSKRGSYSKLSPVRGAYLKVSLFGSEYRWRTVLKLTQIFEICIIRDLWCNKSTWWSWKTDWPAALPVVKGLPRPNFELGVLFHSTIHDRFYRSSVPPNPAETDDLLEKRDESSHIIASWGKKTANLYKNVVSYTKLNMFYTI